MFKEMLTVMSEQTAQSLAERVSFRASWYKEWADLFLKAYAPDAKVVYTSLYAFPMEILAAFDVAPFDFEIAGGSLISSTEWGVPTMCAAENRGFSRDICSFHRAGLGGYYLNYFPRPHLIITTSHYCDGKAKANDILGSLYGIEPLLLYVPATINKDSIGYVEHQLRAIAARIGEVAGQALDEDRLKEAVRSSNRARRSQMEILELLKHAPNPWDGQVQCGYSINGQLFAGSPVMERLHEALLQELQARIHTGKLRPERHRLYWFAWLPTYPSNLFEILKEHQVGVSLCETFRVFGDEIDEDNPFEGLALKCLTNPFVGATDRRTKGLENLKEEYRLDGALLFATPCCRQSKAAYRLLKEKVNEIGMPFAIMDMDIADSRGYSPEQTRTRLEAFIELLDAGM